MDVKCLSGKCPATKCPFTKRPAAKCLSVKCLYAKGPDTKGTKFVKLDIYGRICPEYFIFYLKVARVYSLHLSEPGNILYDYVLCEKSSECMVEKSAKHCYKYICMYTVQYSDGFFFGLTGH